MDFELKSLTAAQVAQLPVDALLVLVPDTPPTTKSADQALTRLVAQAVEHKDLENGVAKLLACYRPEGFKASRVTLVRVGDGSAASVRKAVTAGMGSLKQPGIQKLALVFSLIEATDDGVRAAMQACADATYCYTTTKPSAKARTVKQVVVGVAKAGDVQRGFEVGKAQVVGVEFAKEWANRPANHATPTMLGEAARKLGRKPGMKTDVLGPKQVEALGMGSFLSVARGSVEPLRFIVMHYNGGAKGSAPVVLVGKGITFDTGGISIKPAADMDEMKFDMGGAASVLGTFAALAELKPAINVVGLIPSCENMPDGQAVKPGDVVTSMSGQTIEILNTDAEGRLILCDALTYAERFKPRAVVDVATLTGACMIALGSVRSGLFASTEELANQLMAAGEAAQDLCWRLPLDDDYADGLKTNFADVANVAGRAGGAITAAKFLQRFASKYPWAHLDIAGSAWKSGAAKGATGRPVGLLLDFLLASQASKPAATKTRQRRAA
ncbi:leucyl aminopeptidase [Hydrogenophaga sp.]|uniref:leucyl aminopeptidase n=1 Tax=Hydrogenophaga sp. TaxID=1904254 RepID=UPI0027305949|nr:leucyl aminopeptidase [Hydrogenophaga sp.]MDP2017766.1 leucyl aminopeptidase [Hydrogenophaga sp.]